MITNSIVILIALMMIFIIVYDGKRKKIDTLYLILRSIMIILLVIAWINPKFDLKTNKNTTYFLVDQSYSQLGVEHIIEKDILDAMKVGKSDQAYEVVVFGSEAATNSKSLGAIETLDLKENNIVKTSTNYQEAIDMVISRMDLNENARIILMTDGLENEGSILETVNQIQKKNIEIMWKEYNSKNSNEIQISHIDGPETVFEGQGYTNKILIESNVKTEANMKIYLNNNMISEKEISVQPGKNAFEIYIEGTDNENQLLEVEIFPKKDTIIENNKYSNLVEVTGKSKIMLVQGNIDKGLALEKILKNTGSIVEKYPSENLPENLATILEYNAIIFCDVSLEKISSRFINNVEIYVKEYGGGLFVTGGENSYALGGYYDSEFEKMLPLKMERKQDGVMDDMGLIVIVDESGSMMSGDRSRSKLDMAKEASVKAVSSMMPKDQIGILAFSDEQKWVVPLGEIDDKNRIKSQISTIGGGGGTSIIPALEEAYSQLANVKTKYKHIILVTDGQAESNGYNAILKKLRDSEITLTTLGIGVGADNILLRYLANNSNGRFYKVDNYMNIPKIFTKETSMVSKKYLNNRNFYPKLVSDNSILNPIINEMPILQGYISTSKKNRSETLLVSDEDEPILAYWKYGLGNVYCWTSDVDGIWNAAYLETKEGSDFYMNIINDLLNRKSENFDYELTQNGNIQNIKIYFEKLNSDWEFKILDRNGKEENYLVDSIAGGEKINFQSYRPGIYTLIGKNKDDNIIKKSFVTNYSREYDFTTKDTYNFKTWMNKVDGFKIEDVKDIGKQKIIKKSSGQDIWKYIIMIFVIIFLVDIYFRKFGRHNSNVKEKLVEDLEISDKSNNIETKEINIEKLIKNKDKKV